MSHGCGHGGPATPGIGAELDRYKITHWFNILIFLAESVISRALRDEILRHRRPRNLLF
jgi:hypothetical protein